MKQGKVVRALVGQPPTTPELAGAKEVEPTESAGLRWPDRNHSARISAPDAILLLALMVLATVVRRPWYMLSHPFWLDEAWVADSVRAPFHSVPFLTSSTPLGWTALLRIVPPLGGPQRYRMLPLLFAVSTVVPAYFIGRTLYPGGRVGAMVTGLAVAMIPNGLLRHDLKQYTADAFMAVLLVWLTVRLEGRWSRERLWVLVVASAMGLLVSHAVAFVASGVWVALFLVNLGRRSWSRIRDVVVAGGALLVAAVAVYDSVDRRGVNPRLTAYWSRFYVPIDRGIESTLDFLVRRGNSLLEGLHLGPWWVALLLALLGSISLWRRDQRAVAILVPIVAVEMIIASIARRYPLGDQRTSLFFTTQIALTGAIGVSDVARRVRRLPSVATAIAVGFLVLLVIGASQTYGTPLPNEDVRGPARYLASHRRSGDSIVVSRLAAYAFAYYWSGDRPMFVPTDVTAVTFTVEYARRSRIVVASGFTDRDITAALDTAAAQTDPGGRVWIVLSHLPKRQLTSWLEGAEALGRVTPIGAFPRSLYMVSSTRVPHG